MSALPAQGPGEGEALAVLKRRLRRLRVERGLSMAGLALRASLGRTTASQALNGAAIPSEPTLVSLAKALRTSPEPFLELRSAALAQAGGVPKVANAATPPDRPRQETRFTFDYLAQRPTSLLRTLHDKLRLSHVVGLRIRTVDIFQSWDVEDPELPARSAQYADECLESMPLIQNVDEAAEALLLVAALSELNESRSARDRAHASVRDDIDGCAMVFLDGFGIDSVHFFNVRSVVGSELAGKSPPWHKLNEIRSDLAEIWPR
ncbi:hypothetical protein DEJ50_06925 [Streptomyces venezuelae]|uniref:HTH cro/C1-type domain-containing protein n=1 Tax=Streptomyces venezuelae TaxID=54571 RepID=A0A5P2DG63_STRVZ|nr:helix-turn-helix domain-containing protein [Streptomyces venezuelae]QES52231.1 hypothetical protein DEJ50_06925 [Streptomyces venezuelae]